MYFLTFLNPENLKLSGFFYFTAFFHVLIKTGF